MVAITGGTRIFQGMFFSSWGCWNLPRGRSETMRQTPKDDRWPIRLPDRKSSEEQGHQHKGCSHPRRQSCKPLSHRTDSRSRSTGRCVLRHVVVVVVVQFSGRRRNSIRDPNLHSTVKVGGVRFISIRLLMIIIMTRRRM
jgi:hypothetical protein